MTGWKRRTGHRTIDWQWLSMTKEPKRWTLLTSSTASSNEEMSSWRKRSASEVKSVLYSASRPVGGSDISTPAGLCCFWEIEHGLPLIGGATLSFLCLKMRWIQWNLSNAAWMSDLSRARLLSVLMTIPSVADRACAAITPSSFMPVNEATALMI